MKNNHIENPIDTFTNWFVIKISPLFYKLGFTPDIISILAFITGMLAVWLLIKQRCMVWTSIALIIISYVLNCLDWQFARKYNMASTFGDYLDYAFDAIKLVALLVALYYVNPKLFRQTLPITITLLILLLGHASCHDDALPLFKNVCPGPDATHYTQFFGIGSFTLYECILTWAICQSSLP